MGEAVGKERTHQELGACCSGLCPHRDGEVLTPSGCPVALFRNRVFADDQVEVIWTLIQCEWHPDKKGRLRYKQEGQQPWEDLAEGAGLRPRGTGLPGARLSGLGHLSSSLCPQNVREQLSCFTLPRSHCL